MECRLLPLVRLAGLDGVNEYVDPVRKVAHGAELDRVVEALTTNETYWFRDVTPFQILTGHVTGMKRREQVFRNRIPCETVTTKHPWRPGLLRWPFRYRSSSRELTRQV